MTSDQVLPGESLRVPLGRARRNGLAGRRHAGGARRPGSLPGFLASTVVSACLGVPL